MKKPDKILQDLSDKSLTENQPIEKWLEFLEDLQQEVNHWVDMVRRDVENKNK